MPFDAIMGVGRTPQMTKDYAVSPYSINPDIANAGNISFYSSITLTNKTGRPENLIDNSFDSSQISFQTAWTSAGDISQYFILDLGKEIFIKEIKVMMTYTYFDVTYNNYLSIWVSNDNVNYTKLIEEYQYPEPIRLPSELVYSYTKARFIKILYTAYFNAGGGETKFYKLQVKPDYMQY